MYLRTFGQVLAQCFSRDHELFLLCAVAHINPVAHHLSFHEYALTYMSPYEVACSG